jgi:hypothetical protein
VAEFPAGVMKIMKVIGVYNELGRDISDTAPSIFANADQMNSEFIDAVVSYLKSGVPIFDVMEGVVDPFNPSKIISGGSSLLSDGEWVWRNDLAYFVEQYKLGLPKEFLESVRLNKSVDSTKADEIIGRWEEALTAYERVAIGN